MAKAPEKRGPAKKAHAKELKVGPRVIDPFRVGDTVSVKLRIVEGAKERMQTYEGVCIGIQNKGIGRTFTVRKISGGVGVERIFPFASPRIDTVKLVRHGRVRRAKLFHLRGKSGKESRIKERRMLQEREAQVVATINEVPAVVETTPSPVANTAE